MDCKEKVKEDSKFEIKEGGDVDKEIDRHLFNHRIINFHEDVDDETIQWLMSRLDVLDAISDETILLKISSYGGSVYSTVALIDFMNRMRSPVDCIVQGKAMSAGLIIAACCTGERKMEKSAYMMYHECSTVDYGKLSNLEMNLQHTRKLWNTVIKHLMYNTGLPKQWFKDNERKEVFLSAKESKKLGFVDKVI